MKPKRLRHRLNFNATIIHTEHHIDQIGRRFDLAEQLRDEISVKNTCHYRKYLIFQIKPSKLRRAG